MVTIALVEGSKGTEHRTFECQKCGHSEERVVVVDPLKSDAVGWTDGELRPPQYPRTHEIQDGRLVPKPAK
jgi:hypothetical protein